jgi:hypothetical protein
MENDAEKMARFKRRAENCRTLAAQINDEEARKGMLKTAESYDRMAVELAIRMGGNPPPSKTP